MADDILSRYQQAQQAEQNQELSGAVHDMQWKNTFTNTPPIEVMRSRLNLAETVDRAIGNKIKLQAQSDVKALNILQKSEKHAEWQRQAPLREELLRRKVESEGAHERFVQRKDTEAMSDLQGFFDTIGTAKAKPGTPEYRAILNEAIRTHPRIIGTQAGADALKNLQREHEDIAAITPPEGMEIDRMDFSDDGRAKAVFRPIPAPATGTVPDGMVPSSATVNKRGDVSVNYAAPKAEGSTAKTPTPDQQGFLGRYGESVTGIKEMQPALDKAGLDIKAQWADLDAAAKAGKISEDEARKANHWLTKFRAASGKAASDADYEAHFNELAAKVGALQSKGAPSVDAVTTFDTPEGFTAAFKAAKSGETITFKGKQYRKP